MRERNQRIIKAQYREQTFSDKRDKRIKISKDKDGDYNVYLDGEIQKNSYSTKEEAEE